MLPGDEGRLARIPELRKGQPDAGGVERRKGRMDRRVPPVMILGGLIGFLQGLIVYTLLELALALSCGMPRPFFFWVSWMFLFLCGGTWRGIRRWILRLGPFPSTTWGDVLLGGVGLLLALGLITPFLLLRSRHDGPYYASMYGVGGLRTIESAQKEYWNQSSPHTYARSLKELGPGVAGGERLLSESLEEGSTGMHVFSLGAGGFRCDSGTIRGVSAAGCVLADCEPAENGVCKRHGLRGAYTCWHAEAHPQRFEVSACFSFYTDQGGELRGGNLQGRPGTAELPPWDYYGDRFIDQLYRRWTGRRAACPLELRLDRR